MSVKRMLFFLSALALTVGFAGVEAKADPGIPDTVRVESVQVNAGDHFGVDVFLFNDEALSGGTLGFRWGTPDLFLDSISYVGSVLETKQHPESIDNSTNYETLTGFFIIFDPPMAAGSGKWCTFWMTAQPGAVDQVIPFDSIKIQPSGDFVLIAQSDNSNIEPQFVLGEITIGNPVSNTPPTLATIGPKGVAEGSNLNFGTSATDAESVPLLTAVGLPVGATYVDAGAGTATFDWTPNFTDSGTYPVTFIASDGELSDSELVIITVTNTIQNSAPVWSAVTPQNVDEGAHLSYGVTATDVDLDLLTLTALSVPTNGGFTDNGAGSGTVTFDPDFTQSAGSPYSFVLEVSDGTLTDTVSVTVSVNDLNRAPVWAAVTPQNVDEGANLTYGVSASDPDGNGLTLTALSVPTNGGFTDNGAGSGTVTFDPDFTQAAGSPYSFILEVSDDFLTDTVSVIVSVNDINRIPTLAVINDTTIEVGQTLTILATSSDPDGTFPTLTLNGLPAVNATFNDNGDGTGLFTFTPGAAQGNTLYSMEVVARDADTSVNFSVTEPFAVSVGAAPIPDSAFVSPDTFFYAVDEGGFGGPIDGPVGCAVVSSNGLPLSYTAVLSGTPVFTDLFGVGGTYTTDSICFQLINTNSLTPGVYTNEVAITFDGASNNPIGFVIQLTVNEVIVVDTSVLFLSQKLFEYQANVDSPEAFSDTLMVMNIGTGPDFDWTLTKSFSSFTDTNGVVTEDGIPTIPAGVTIAPLSGTTPGPVTINVSTAGLTEPGEYYCEMQVDGTSGVFSSPQFFEVVITILPSIPPDPDSAFISVDTLWFTAVEGQENVQIGCATLSSTNSPANYTGTFSGSPTIISNDLASGVTDDTVCVFVGNSNLAPGVYYNTASYEVAGVVNSPVDFVVCLTIEAGPTPDSAYITPDTLWFTLVEGEQTADTGCAFLSSTNAPAPFSVSVLDGINPGRVVDTAHVFLELLNPSGMTDDSVCVATSSGFFPAGVYYNTVQVSVAGVVNNPVDFVVCLTVEAPQVTHTASVTPDTLFFTIAEGDASGGVGCAHVNSTNAPATYTAGATGSPFFTDLFGGGGTTNDSICFEVVNTSTLTPGVYYNDVAINVENVVNNPVGFVVCLTVDSLVVIRPSVLALSDTTFWFGSVVDSPVILGDSLTIFNVGQGPDFGWSIVKDTAWYVDTNFIDTTFFVGPSLPFGLSISPLVGSTPGTAYISLDTDGLAPGEYYCPMQVVADVGVEGSPQYFAVQLIVRPSSPPALSILEVSDSVFTYFAHEGDTNPISDSLSIFNTGDGPEIDWQIAEGWCVYINPLTGDTIELPGTPIDFGGPLFGTTPSTLFHSMAIDTLPVGEYWCNFFVEALDSSVLNSPRTITVHLTINPRVIPSSDTLWVATVPGTPGSKVKVPVYLSSHGPTCGVQVMLEWGSSQIYLDSVSFEGTRLEGLALTESTFDNGNRSVSISFAAESFAMAAGSGKIANLHFDIFSGITDGGVVPITLDSRLFCPQCNPIVDNCTDDFFPTFFPGGIVIDSSANVICGRVVDTAGNEISDATVEVWDFFPQGNLFASAVTGVDGAFKFNQLYVTPYSLHAYANGYYPATLEDINFGSLGLEIVLTPVSIVKPTNEWVDFYCDVNNYMGLPLPIGSVVDAFDPDGDHVGTWTVAEIGKYGFMPVYRDDAFTPEDDGANPGDTITFYINGMPAETSGERVWTTNGDRFEVCLNYDGSVDKSYCLTPGWNLISWNVDTEVDDVEALFGPIMSSIDVILGFEEVGLTYDPALPDFSTLTSADHLHGYWVHVVETAFECIEWNISGLPVLVNTPITLEEGWNLVSYLPPVSLPTGSALVSQEDNLRVALGFDGGGLTYEPLLPEFSTLDTLRPCFGYWLKVFSTSDLIYPGFNSLPYIKPDETNFEALSPLAKLGVEGELHPTSEWLNLYSGNLSVDGEQVSGGASIRALNASGELVGFGVTSAAGRLLFTPVYGSSSDDEVGLKVGEEFTLEIDGQTISETFTYSERGARIELSVLTSTVNETVLPEEFALAQNYPNPFNPKTNITFQLPRDAEVMLEVFNVLGEKIATLANGRYSAGETTVSWEARDDAGNPVASGVYFYRLKAGADVRTQKMVLLK